MTSALLPKVFPIPAIPGVARFVATHLSAHGLGVEDIVSLTTSCGELDDEGHSKILNMLDGNILATLSTAQGTVESQIPVDGALFLYPDEALDAEHFAGQYIEARYLPGGSVRAGNTQVVEDATELNSRIDHQLCTYMEVSDVAKGAMQLLREADAHKEALAEHHNDPLRWVPALNTSTHVLSLAVPFPDPDGGELLVPIGSFGVTLVHDVLSAD